MLRLKHSRLVVIHPGNEEVIEEIVVVKTIFFMKFTRTYRRVHGIIFRYNTRGYNNVSRNKDIESFFDEKLTE